MDFEFLVPEDARLRARISQRSNLKYVSKVLELFDERQRHDFRESSLGFLADVPDIQFSAQLIQQLVFRSIRTDKTHELWFNIQGHYCRFGLQEYALVTGLRCGVPPNDNRFYQVLDKSRLKDKYFKSLDKISCVQLEKTCARLSTSRDDRYKLGLALIVEGVFKAPDNNVGIDAKTLSLVDDLDIFFTYPWGRVGYSRLIKGFQGSWAKKFRDAKRKREKKISYTVHGFPIAMQIWAFEAILEIGTHFGQRIGECSPRLLSWMATKQSQQRTYDAFFKRVHLHVYATLRPTDLERNQHYMSTLVPFDDHVVPALDNIARTVVNAQLESNGELSGEGQVDRESYEETFGGSDDVGIGVGGREGPSTTEYVDSSSDDSGDGHDDARSDSGNGERKQEHTRGGMTGAFSAAYGPRQDYFGDSAPSTSRHRGVQSGGGLTRSDVEDMLLDQRVIFEMRLRTVKLEIFEHVTAEFARLRDFISIVGPPISTTSVAPHDVHNDLVPSSFSPRDDIGRDIDQKPEAHNAALDRGQHDMNIVSAVVDDERVSPQVNDVQFGMCNTKQQNLDVPGGDMEPEVHGMQIDDAPTTSDNWLLTRAEVYQEYMNLIPVPTLCGSLMPFNSWIGLGRSIKQLYGQPLHYLTNISLKQWDQSRIGAKDEQIPLDTIIHPCKAEASIWLMEEVNRLTTSHHHLAKLWLADPMHHAFIDPIFPKLRA